MKNKPDKVFTNCFVLDSNASKILLGMKKLRFGAGWWNGFGGKVRKDENIESAAKRELKSESGLTAINLEKIGVLKFRFKVKPMLFECYIFVAGGKGKLRETPEMRPEWFDVQLIPYHQMWSGDKLWLPFVLKKQKFLGEIFYDSPEGNNVLDCKISLVENF